MHIGLNETFFMSYTKMCC